LQTLLRQKEEDENFVKVENSIDNNLLQDIQIDFQCFNVLVEDINNKPPPDPVIPEWVKPRISHLVTNENIESWEDGDNILFDAQTDSGKTWFIINPLYYHCKKRKLSILFLTNRDLLKSQFVVAVEENKRQDIITIKNYQYLETLLSYGKEPKDHYDIIVADEIHYVFGDVYVNENTDLSINWLINATDSIKIMLSATSKHIREYLEVNRKQELIVYSMKRTNEYIENVCFYEDDKALMKMLLELPPDEKVMYFCGAEKAYQASNDLFDKAEFICSKHNRTYKKYSNEIIQEQIITEKKFDCQVLCTTSVLDCGVSIEDVSLKHMIVDYFDLDTLIQCLGRKRVMHQNDKITVYIKNRGKQSLKLTLNKFNGKLNKANYLVEYGGLEYVKKYGRKEKNTAVYYRSSDKEIEACLNDVVYFKLNKDVEAAENMKESGFDFKVCQELEIDYSTTSKLEDTYDAITLRDIVENLRDKKLFVEVEEENGYGKDDFIQLLLGQLFSPPKEDHGSCGMKTINSLFEDNNLDFEIKSRRERSKKSINFNKTYWIITDKKINR